MPRTGPTRERLDYTNLLFDLLAELVPAGVEGSVSTSRYRAQMRFVKGVFSNWTKRQSRVGRPISGLAFDPDTHLRNCTCDDVHQPVRC